jgi:hypothetical protein
MLFLYSKWLHEQKNITTNKTEIAVPAPTEKKESSTPSKEVSTIVETVKEKD